MTKTNLTQGVWTEVFTGVTSAAFNLINSYSGKMLGYRIHWGTVAPAVDTDVYNLYELEDVDDKVYALPIQFTNSTAANVYIMPIQNNGAITY